MFQTLRGDFSTRRRERCLRLDPLSTGAGITMAGVEELERLVREAVQATFQGRAAAYDEEVAPPHGIVM